MKRHRFLLSAGCLFALSSLFGAEPIVIRASDYEKARLFSYQATPGDIPARVKASGNLAGFEKEKKKNPGIAGEYRYSFEVPADGWYEISAGPDGISITGVEYTLDETIYLYPIRPLMKTRLESGKKSLEESILGNFYLKKGVHHLKAEKRQWPHSFPRITEFRIKPSLPENQLRVTLTDSYSNEITAAKGEKIHFKVEYCGLKTNSTLSAVFIESKTGKEIFSIPLKLTASDGLKMKPFSIPCEKEGIFEIRFRLNGRELLWPVAPPHSLVVIDSAPVKPSVLPLKKTLIEEIDCVKRAPDFVRGNHPVKKSVCGYFREISGKSGWDKDKYKETPEWIAYKALLPKAEEPYLFEFDYPDDGKRATHFSLRSFPIEGHYPKTVGINSGGEFHISEKMQTASFVAHPNDRDIRLLIMSGGMGLRGGVSKIRIYRIENPVLPPLFASQKGNRQYQYFYEEAPSLIQVMTGVDLKWASPEVILKGIEWYCAQNAYMGSSEQFYTLEIYGGGLYPSRYRPSMWTLPFEKDFVKKFSLIAQKYGQNVVFDFHPALSDFNKKEHLLFNPENRLLNNGGKEYYFNLNKYLVNPIHPDTRKWRLAMLTEFVERYKNIPNFTGIRIRQMPWQHSGWASFTSLNWGYDDYTISRFEEDTGIPVRTQHSDHRRFEERYAYLTQQKHDQWIAWRTQKITELYVEILNAIRAIRSDLKLYCNITKVSLEGGADGEVLQKHGIITSKTTNTGRPPLPVGLAERERIFSLKEFEAKPDAAGCERSISHWQFYYEGGSKIALPSELGYTVGKNQRDKVYYCSSAWPAGRNELEFWALGMARRDISIFVGGSIGYGVGNPIMREFMNEFLRLPSPAFETVLKDPVAIRRYKEYFYAVNSLPVPVKVSIALKNGIFSEGKAKRITDGSMFDVSNFELKPYQLMAFTTNTEVVSAKVEVPASYRNVVAKQVEQLEKTAKTLPALKDLSANVAAAFAKGEFCTVRLLLEINMPLMAENGLYIPSLRAEGELEIPENALSEPKSDSKHVPAKSLFRDWNKGTFHVGSSVVFHPEIPADGTYRIKAAFLGGDEYGKIHVYSDGKKIGSFDNPGGLIYAIAAQMKGTFVLTKGKHHVEFRSDSEKPVGILYLCVESVFEPVYARYFRMSPTIFTEGGVKAINHIMAKKEPAEINRDFSGTFWQQPVQHKDPKNSILNLGGGEVGITSYLLTYIYSPSARTVQISIGADYFWKIWCNDILVQDTANQGGGGAIPDSARYFLKLKAGWNEIMIKIGSGTNGNCMWFAVNNPGDLKFSSIGPRTVSIRRDSVKGNLLLNFNFDKKPVPGRIGKAFLSLNSFEWKGGAIELHSANTKGDFGILFPVKGGKKYLFRAEVSPVNSEMKAVLRMDWKTGKSFSGKVEQPQTLATDWQLVSGTGQAPADAEFVVLSLNGASSENPLRIKQLELYEL